MNPHRIILDAISSGPQMHEKNKKRMFLKSEIKDINEYCNVPNGSPTLFAAWIHGQRINSGTGSVSNPEIGGMR